MIEPEKVISVTERLKAARSELKNLLSGDQLKEDNQLAQAKTAFAEIYLAKINSKLASVIPKLDILAQQSEIIQDNETAAHSYNALSKPIREEIFKEDGTSDRLFERLDYLRNGIALNEDGASAISQRIQSQEALGSNQALFSPEEVARLKAEKVSPEDTQIYFTEILKRAGIHKDQIGEKGFDVEINPGKTIFSVDSSKNHLKVGNKERPLDEVLVVGVAHEFEHISQAMADKRVGEVVKIAGQKGKRVGGLKEAGALRSENEARFKLFGETKPRVNTYGAALKKLEQGEPLENAIQAFYDEKLKYSPNLDKTKVAQEAANRVVRLLRFPGQNSQPLAYAEAMILEDELKSCGREAKSRATAITSLDLVDQMRLHQFGLLPDIDGLGTDWLSIGLEVLEERIAIVLGKEVSS